MAIPGMPEDATHDQLPGYGGQQTGAAIPDGSTPS